MNDSNLFTIGLAAFAFVIGLGNYLLKQGEAGLRTRTLQLDEKEVTLKLVRSNADQVSNLQVSVMTLTSQLAAISAQYNDLIKENASTRSELAMTKAQLAASDQRVVELTAEVKSLRLLSDQQAVELAALRESAVVKP